MYKAYKFRLYPNDIQKDLIHKTFGCYRFIYNYFLNDCMSNGYQKAIHVLKVNLKDKLIEPTVSKVNIKKKSILVLKSI